MKTQPKNYILYCKKYDKIPITLVKIAKNFEYAVYYFVNHSNIGLPKYEFSEPFVNKMIQDGRLKEEVV